ncbi:alanine acetyltransferase [Ureibacillus massiliensis 4400831 = CIP 108448 = CCUG 49529]|uniref:Alanine acetyltransferase n=1 Tax=Ureibacillus massiliensis 4400831 = CIP 108448 = CCUG 49529 TaxID=1211035 RepID=A0A0A3J1V4_9BACL|nr:alanine acetyltransferase [Ureibacillus massiliensis 4400831 = CIP 108448 = CCUG 49529]BDH63094.1 putative ribosomal-protein-alanine acetyltransferase [Lysinibacillus sp. PLM2]
MVRIEGDRCYLRTFIESDARSLSELLTNNKYYWAQYEPLHDDYFYTEDAQLRKILESMQLMRVNREYSFGIYTKGRNQLIGHISLYAIKRLPYSSAFIGYSIDERFTKKGIATEAVNHLIHFAFNELNLHRIEAYVSPKNIGSIKVLERAKFVKEGLLRKLLYINGVWEDHYMYSILQEDYNF